MLTHKQGDKFCAGSVVDARTAPTPLCFVCNDRRELRFSTCPAPPKVRETFADPLFCDLAVNRRRVSAGGMSKRKIAPVL
jgi:hypothetical protein